MSSSERPTNYPPQTPERGALDSSGENARRTIDPSNNLLLPTIRSGEESNNNIDIHIPSLDHRYDVPTTRAAPMDYNVAQAWITSGNQQTSSSNGSTSNEESGLEAFQDELADSVRGDSSKDKSSSSNNITKRRTNPLRGLRKNLFSSAAQQAQQEGNQMESGWQQQRVETGQLHIVEQYNQFDSWLAQNEANGSMPSTPPVSLPSTPPSIPDDLMNLSNNSSKVYNNNNNHAKHSYGQTPIPDTSNQDEKKDNVQDANGSFKAVANPGDIEESPFEWMRNPSVPNEIVLDDDQQGNMEDELLTGDGGENSINLHNKNVDSNQLLFRPPTLGGALSRPVAIRGEDRQITPQSWHTPISMLPISMTKRTASGGSRRSVPLSPGSRRSAKSEKYFHSYKTNLGGPPKTVPPFVVVHNSGSAVVTVTPKRTTVVPSSKPKLGKSRKIRKAAAATAAAAADLEPIIAEESIRSGKEANCGCDGEEAKVWCRMWGRPVSIAVASAVLALAIVTVVTSLVASRFQSPKPQDQPQLRPRVPEPTLSPTVAPSKGFPDFGIVTNGTSGDLDSSWEGAILRPYEGNETGARPTAPPRTLPPNAAIPTFAPSMLPDNFPDFVPTSAPFLQESEDDFDEENVAFQIPWNNYVIGLLSVESPSTFTYFDDPTSPQFLALQWISVDSSRKGGSIAYTMDASLQRFALATVYFSLGGIDDWFESDNWLSTVVPVCEWKGVSCDSSNSAVLSIDLHSNNLSGSLPDELKLLKYLQVLNFHENAISGSLPPAYARLYEMKELDLSGNSLTGSIPEEYGGAGAFEWLKVLDVSHNGIEGSLPSQLGNLKQLETIRMCDNAMTGTVPSALGSLGQLRSVKLGNNELTGDLPGAICDSTSDIVFDCTVECECCTSCCAHGEDCC